MLKMHYIQVWMHSKYMIHKQLVHVLPKAFNYYWHTWSQTLVDISGSKTRRAWKYQTRWPSWKSCADQADALGTSLVWPALSTDRQQSKLQTPNPTNTSLKKLVNSYTICADPIFKWWRWVDNRNTRFNFDKWNDKFGFWDIDTKIE